jgi:hypothetical protein
MKWDGSIGKRRLEIETPAEGEGEIALDPREEVSLKRLRGVGPLSRSRYRLPAGEKVALELKYT